MPPPLLFLAYASNASVAFTPPALVELLSVSRRNNDLAGITGMLLYRGGNFLQALEGPPDAVRETFKRISHDVRHRGIGMLLEEERDHRLFAEWSMAFQEVREADLDRHPGASAYLSRGAEALDAAPAQDHDVFAFFDSFRKNMR